MVHAADQGDVEARLLVVEAAAIVEVVNLLAVEPDGERVVRANHHLRGATGERCDLSVSVGRQIVIVSVDLAEIDLPPGVGKPGGLPDDAPVPGALMTGRQVNGPTGRDREG